MKKFESNTYKTILTICIGLLIIYVFTEVKVLITISIVLGLIGIISKYLSKKIEWMWFKFSEILSYIIPNIILSVIFYFLLFPISIFSKIFRKEDLLQKKYNGSTFLKTTKEFDSNSFTQPF